MLGCPVLLDSKKSLWKARLFVLQFSVKSETNLQQSVSPLLADIIKLNC